MLNEEIIQVLSSTLPLYCVKLSCSAHFWPHAQMSKCQFVCFVWLVLFFVFFCSTRVTLKNTHVVNRWSWSLVWFQKLTSKRAVSRHKTSALHRNTCSRWSTFQGRHLYVWPPVSAESHSCPIVKPSCDPVPSSANLSLLIVTCVALTLTSDMRRFNAP